VKGERFKVKGERFKVKGERSEERGEKVHGSPATRGQARFTAKVTIGGDKHSSQRQ
jgi:hypothetical protein